VLSGLYLWANRFAFVAAFVSLFIAGLAMGAADEISSVPVVTFTVAKATYLSTESPTGSIEINNTTANELYFYTTSIVFLIRDPSGVREDRWIKAFGMVPRPFIILPGKQQTFDVPLPKCEVTSAPCSEHVSIRLSVAPKVGNGSDITTNEQSYAFVPDPTATFEVDGLTNNRPLLIAQGEAQATIPALGTSASNPWFIQQANPFDPIMQQANDEAKSVASQLAAFLDASPLQDANGLTGDSMLLRFSPGDIERAPWVTTSDLLFNDSVKQSLTTTSDRSLVVGARSTRAFIGASAIAPRLDPFASAPQISEAFQMDMREFAWMSLSASIGADRPEVFSVVRVQRESCERLGFNCYSVALILACDRARALAQSLGVEVGYISLVAAYVGAKPWPDDPVLPVGVAMTMDGQPKVRVRPSPSPAPPIGHIMYAPTPNAFLNSMRGGMFTPPPDIVPIEIPDSTNSLSASADIRQTSYADELRIDVRIDPDPNHSGQVRGLPDPGELAKKLHTEPLVVDASSQAGQPNALPVGYELLVRTFDPSQLDRLIARIRTSYQHNNIVIHYGATIAMSSCDTKIVHAQAKSAQAAMQNAVDSAYSSNHRLGRLLLAAAYPPNAPSACMQDPTRDPLDQAPGEKLQIPADRSITIDVPVRLVFRISSK